MNLVQILAAAVAVHGEAVANAGQHQGGHDGGEDLRRKIMTDVRQANEDPEAFSRNSLYMILDM